MHLGRVLCALLCLLVVLSGGEATLSKKDKKGKKKKEQVDSISTLRATIKVAIMWATRNGYSSHCNWDMLLNCA